MGTRDTKREKVMVAYCHSDRLDSDFHHSLLRLKDFDALGPKRLMHRGWIAAVQTTNLADGRNKLVRAFLDEPGIDWLWFIDTDQVFDHDILERMIVSADPERRPVLSALIQARREQDAPLSPACVIFDDHTPPRTVRPQTIPPVRHWPVAAVGTGCVLIHRRVLEAVWAAHEKRTPFPCFEFAPWKRVDDDGTEHLDIMGEDYTFCFRAAALGFPAYVDTEIEAGHNKTITLTSVHFWAQQPDYMVPAKNYAVIPVKDGLKMTKNLLAQLEEQGDVSGVLVIDNGSGPETKTWLARQSFAEVVEMPGAGIHAMWNVGAEWARSKWRKPNIAFLNNDIELGEHCLGSMGMALRSDPNIVAACPNYDGRPGEGLQQLQGICADRYDGSGGLSGFAFAVKGELFEQYRFPEDCMWWFGDNDLTLTIDAMGGAYVMTHDTTVTHLDGGGKTGAWDDPKMQAQLAKDQAAFRAKWQPILAGEAA
jgi:hypothetical protein